MPSGALSRPMMIGLGEQLADDPKPSGAKRGAYRDLSMADRGAGEQQIGDVRAGDQEHERHGAHHREDRRVAHRLGSSSPSSGRITAAPALVLVRIRRCQPRRDRLKIGCRLLPCDARLQPCKHLHGTRVAPAFSRSTAPAATHEPLVSGNMNRGGITPMTV